MKWTKVIKSKFYESGHDSSNFEGDYIDIILTINGKDKKVSIYVYAEYDFDWSKQDDTYDEPGYRSAENINININDIKVFDDDKEYDEEECNKILKDNYDEIESLIEDDIETQIYESDWEDNSNDYLEDEYHYGRNI